MNKKTKKILGAILMVGGIVFCASEAETFSAALWSGWLGLLLFTCGLYLLTRGS